jgi:multidrug resistance efflux pump
MQTHLKKHTTRLYIFLLFATLALAGCDSLPLGGAASPTPIVVPVVTPGDTLTIEGRLVPVRDAWLSFEQAGILAAAEVEAGDEVQTGDVLARLADRQQLTSLVQAAELEVQRAEQAIENLNEQADLRKQQTIRDRLAAERALLEAEQALDDLDTPAFQDELDEAWERIQEEQDNLENAQEAFERVSGLSEDNSTRQNAEDDLDEAQQVYNDATRDYARLQSDLQQAQADVDLARANLAEAQRLEEAWANGVDPDELSLAEKNLAAAQANLESIQEQLALRSLVAPFAAMVTEVRLIPGEAVTAYSPLIQLADFSEWFVETTGLTEIDLTQINLDQPVTVAADALPDVELTGEIVSVSPVYTEKAGDVLYEVRIRLTETVPELRWGMTVEVSFKRK